MSRQTMSVTIENLGGYLFKYISEYRNMYDAFTSAPPNAAGHPKINVSPFLESQEFDVFLSLSIAE